MKKNLVFTMMVLVMVLTTQAQMFTSQENVDKNNFKELQYLQDSLQLTVQQYQQVSQLFQMQRAKVKAKINAYQTVKNDNDEAKAACRAEINQIGIETEYQLQTILSAAQFSKYRKMREDRMAR